jgi:hypothetical protein
MDPKETENGNVICSIESKIEWMIKRKAQYKEYHTGQYDVGNSEPDIK